MAGIGTIVVQTFDGLFRSAILAVLRAIVPAMAVSTNLFTTGTLSAWEAVLFISESLLALAVVLVAYSLFTGIPIHGRGGTSRTLSRLLVAIVLMPFTLYFAQLVLDINDAMTSFVLPYSELATYSSSIAAKLGGFSIGALLLLGIVTMLLYLVLIVRALLVFFTAAIMPLLLLCDVFGATRSFSRKMFSFFLEMAFLPFFMAVGFRIAIATSYSTFSSLQVPSLVIAGTYILPLIMPFIISPGGARVMQFLGLPSFAAVAGAASVISMGAATYAAGFFTSPFRRAASGGKTAAPVSGRRSRFAGAFDAGSRHGRFLLERAAGTAARSGQKAVSPLGAQPLRRPGGAGVGGKTGQESSPHRIYAGGGRNG